MVIFDGVIWFLRFCVSLGFVLVFDSVGFICLEFIGGMGRVMFLFIIC